MSSANILRNSVPLLIVYSDLFGNGLGGRLLGPGAAALPRARTRTLITWVTKNVPETTHSVTICHIRRRPAAFTPTDRCEPI